MHTHHASRARRRLALLFVSTLVILPAARADAQKPAESFTLEQVRSYPFPSELSVGRPARSAIAHRGWGDVSDGSRAVSVDGDERMISARRHEGELAAIR
jgi:hypothetical protein